MANDCNYSMKILGKKENVKTLCDWLSAMYNYEDDVQIKVYNYADGSKWYEQSKDDESNKIPCEHHIGYRVFDSEIFHEYRVDDNQYMALVNGTCAWSVASCMFDFDKSYMNRNKGLIKDSKAISIVDASKELGLKIEIFSEEPGECFSEHYYIDNGKLLCDETTDCFSSDLDYYNKDCEYFMEDMYNELDESTREKVEKAIADGETYIIICDFMNTFGDYKWEYIKE